MGRQAVHFAMGLSGLSSFLMMFGLFMRYHKLSFYSMKVFKALDLEIYLLTGKVEFAEGDACKFIRNVAPESVSQCEDLAGNHDLMDLSHRFCAPAIDSLFKQACSGVSMAYALGLATVIFTIVNMVMQGIATFMLYHYLYKKAQKKYREVSLILACIGTCIVALCLMVYMPAVSMQLDNITVTFGQFGSTIIDVAKGTGISHGYMIMWLAVLVQIVQIILYKYGRISDENRMVEQKMQEQFEAELAYGTGGGGYGGQPGPGGDPYGGSYDPQFAPQSGMGASGGYGGGYPPNQGAGYPPQSGGFQSFPGSQQYASPPPPMPMTGQQWQQPGSQMGSYPQPGYGF